MSAPAPSDDQQDDNVIIKQKLLSADEVYVYKIPPLKNAGGHRAEDWDLANPLKTCALLVERRGDALVLEFTATDGPEGKPHLFCQSQMDLSKETNASAMDHWCEQVVDSSRYFTVKIQGAGGRQALIGFGFRDREQATDLRESIQHYVKSIQRQGGTATNSKAMESLAAFTVPKLAEGETIHVKVGGGKGGASTKKTATKKPASHKGSSAVPLLKKKPPPSSPDAAPTPASPKKAPPSPRETPGSQEKIPASPRKAPGSPRKTPASPRKGPASPRKGPPSPSKGRPPSPSKASKEPVEKIAINMGDIHISEHHNKAKQTGVDGSEGGSSGGAVYEGDEDQWATEFAT